MECSSSGWDCTTLGVLSLGTTLVIGYFLVKMVGTWLSSRLHAFETIMVTLAGAQTLVSTIHFLVHHLPPLEFTVKFFRSLLITFSLSKTMSPLLYGWPRASAALMPAMGVVIIYLVVLYIVALASVDINCSHPTWMTMSVSDAILAMSFGVGGLLVLRALARAQRESTAVPGRPKHSQSYLALKTTQLRILATVNSSSSVLQLTLDLIVGLNYNPEKGCQLVSSDSVGYLLLLILLRILSYAIPVWVIIYTFYWLPRRQYSTDMDLQLDSLTEDLSGGYALMPQQPGHGGPGGDSGGRVLGGASNSFDAFDGSGFGKAKRRGGAEALMDAL